jgi:hypothetical protein
MGCFYAPRHAFDAPKRVMHHLLILVEEDGDQTLRHTLLHLLEQPGHAVDEDRAPERENAGNNAKHNGRQCQLNALIINVSARPFWLGNLAFYGPVRSDPRSLVASNSGLFFLAALLDRLLQRSPAEHGALYALGEFLHAFEQGEFSEGVFVLHGAFTGDDGAEVFQ